MNPHAVKQEPSRSAKITDIGSIKTSFKKRSTLKRTQIHYALKKLGLYFSSIDGRWNAATAKAFTNYQIIEDASTDAPDIMFNMIVNQVDVTYSFSKSGSKH